MYKWNRIRFPGRIDEACSSLYNMDCLLIWAFLGTFWSVLQIEQQEHGILICQIDHMQVSDDKTNNTIDEIVYNGKEITFSEFESHTFWDDNFLSLCLCSQAYDLNRFLDWCTVRTSSSWVNVGPLQSASVMELESPWQLIFEHCFIWSFVDGVAELLISHPRHVIECSWLSTSWYLSGTFWTKKKIIRRRWWWTDKR